MTAPQPDWHGYALDESVTLTPEQSRRVWCIAAVIALYAGRGTPWPRILPIARWIYNGQEVDQ